jgi:hypothetical protein
MLQRNESLHLYCIINTAPQQARAARVIKTNPALAAGFASLLTPRRHGHGGVSISYTMPPSSSMVKPSVVSFSAFGNSETGMVAV